MDIDFVIGKHHLISHAMIYGDGKSYLVALITLNPNETESYARASNLSYDHFADLTRSAPIKALVPNLQCRQLRRSTRRWLSRQTERSILFMERGTPFIVWCPAMGADRLGCQQLSKLAGCSCWVDIVGPAWRQPRTQ